MNAETIFNAYDKASKQLAKLEAMYGWNDDDVRNFRKRERQIPKFRARLLTELQECAFIQRWIEQEYA